MNVVKCTCCGQPLNARTRILRAIENPLIGLLGQRTKLGRDGRLDFIDYDTGEKASLVKTGERIAEALVPYILDAMKASDDQGETPS